MSEIDKLINRAFPDELRNVEPVEVDEDAILALTLQKLSLKEPETPEPEAGGTKKRTFWPVRIAWKEEDLVEAPLVVVRHSWINWAGWVAAACLVVVLAINWGPWLASNLGFGTGQPHKAGDKWPNGADGFHVETPESASEAEENRDTASIIVKPVNAAADDASTFSITLEISGRDGAQVNLDWFDFALTTLDGETVEQISRSNGDGKVLLVYSGMSQAQEYFELTVRQLVPLTGSDGSPAGFDWENVEVLRLNLEYGAAASQFYDGKSILFDGFAANRRIGADADGAS